MLTIRDQQMRVLEKAFLPDWLDRSLRELFPEEFAGTPPSDWHHLIQDGMARTRKLGLGPDQFLPYLSLEVCFGVDFLENPECDWARQVWADGQGTPAERIERLRRAAIFRLADLAEAELRERAAEKESAESTAVEAAGDDELESEV
jgi:hypothetical protein